MATPVVKSVPESPEVFEATFEGDREEILELMGASNDDAAQQRPMERGFHLEQLFRPIADGTAGREEATRMWTTAKEKLVDKAVDGLLYELIKVREKIREYSIGSSRYCRYASDIVATYQRVEKRILDKLATTASA